MKRKNKKSKFWSSCPDCKYGHPENDCVQVARSNGHVDGYIDGHKCGIVKGLLMAASIIANSREIAHAYTKVMAKAKEVEESAK